MPTDTDNVIAFPGVRVASEPATLIIGAHINADPNTVTRVFGVNDQLSLAEFAEALRVLFGWPDAHAASHFLVGGVKLPPHWRIGEVLVHPGDQLVWEWGLWQHMMDVREAFARDHATPDVLLIGGTGLVPGAGGDADDIDIPAINAELTGAESMSHILAGTRDEVVDLIDRAGALEFIPLLQALDLRRPSGCAPEMVAAMRALPVETAVDDAAGRDAAWVTILGLAALLNEELRHDVATHTMDRLMWCREDGYPLSGEEIDDLCAGTLQVLADVGVVGENALPADTRLGLLREALRR
ncbi:hypothetical protein KRX51_00555 [Corynebacterium sp. TAE3-ERU12]|uniref:hypothetical protein n=1 Tax=Corynebacterium sp. TAE3-ERU12 TaxID=2849491 RepID=UPI001C452946|nr:hypothetical protein [Corynebacterium sp. TAE3-ERU12]MBV7294415.1 hypothetical protein [Corynebacterium sp. TAE3-ERU12]